jgi:hypothetical protein
MVSFAIDPELRIRGRPETVLRQSDEALTFLRKKILSLPGGPWQDLLALFEAIHDEWSALEAVVRLEILLEAEGLLIEAKRSGPRSQVNLVSLDVAPVENSVDWVKSSVRRVRRASGWETRSGRNILPGKGTLNSGSD